MRTGAEIFYKNEIPQWAKNKGACTVSFAKVSWELADVMDIEITGIEDEQTTILTDSFTPEEKDRLRRELKPFST